MSRYHVSLESYRIFCTVAKCGNITKAAEELFVTQPTVSMLIKSMEDKLGSSLFVRSQKGVKLTSEGRELYSYLAQAIALIDIAEQKYYAMTQIEGGEVNIGASDSIISGLLLPYLERFKQTYNGISIKVMNRTTKETIELIKNGNIDFGFINLPIANDEEIEVLGRIPVHDCIVYSTKFEHLSHVDFDIREIVKYPLVMLKRSSNVRLLLDNYAAEHGVSIIPAIELDSTDLLLKFAKINFGIAFAIQEFVRNEIDNRVLFLKLIQPAIPSRAIGIIKHKRVPLSHATNRFVESILSEVKTPLTY